MNRERAASEFERVFRRYRRDAVLLHQPYPPHAGRRTNSKLGGLPRLPAHYEWPRASDGTPLHFYAQIDCADIGFRTPLPDRGVLFFFGRDDDDHLWNQDGPASDDCRVLYALDASAATPRREAPVDLPQLGGSYPHERWPGFAHEGGRGPNLRDEWPIHPLPMASWPDALPDAPDSRLLALRDILRSRATSRGEVWDRWRAGIKMLLAGFDADPKENWKEAEARERRYKEELERLRIDAFTEVTGERRDRDPNDTVSDTKAGKAIFALAEEGPEAYPQHWVTVRHCALALLYRPSNVRGSDPVVEAQLASAAEDWLRRANQAGLEAAVPDEERRAFRAWLTSLRRPDDDEQPLSHGAANLVFASMYATVQSLAGDPSRAARLPPAVYETLRYQFNSLNGSRVQFWQMLGHAPSPQRPLPPDDPTLCLLTDPGGFCTF
jgi:hypothetical protein